VSWKIVQIDVIPWPLRQPIDHGVHWIGIGVNRMRPACTAAHSTGEPTPNTLSVFRSIRILFYARFYHCTAYTVYFHWLHVHLLRVILNINQSINVMRICDCRIFCLLPYFSYISAKCTYIIFFCTDYHGLLHGHLPDYTWSSTNFNIICVSIVSITYFYQVSLPWPSDCQQNGTFHVVRTPVERDGGSWIQAILGTHLL